MRPVFEEYSNWVNGVATSANPDMLPESFSPRGRNTHLLHIGQGAAVMGARRGLATCNTTPVTSSPVILGQYQLKRQDGTKVHLLVSDGGRLDKLSSSFVLSAVNATAFTAGTNYPSFATVNNNAIIANGVNLKKTDGTTVWAVGITRPAAPTAAVAAGGSMSTGIWDVALTYFNSTTGEESSLSDFTSVTTAAANLKINVSWSAPSDAQVDYVRVYLRKQTLGANIYLLIAGVTPAVNATWNGYAVATTATVIDVSDTIFGALRLLAPTTTSNNPPATTLQYPVWHNARLFLFDSGNAYYSNITDGTSHSESFDPLNVQPINPSDGDTIMGAISAFDRLYIFKQHALWQIVGYDPASWTVSRVSDRYGLGSHRSLVMAGGVAYWWANSALGPLSMTGADTQPLELGKELIQPTVNDTALNTLLLRTVVGVVDEANDLVVWAVPAAGATSRNSQLIPFNYRLKRFDADLWNPMDIASFAVVEDLTSSSSVYVGGYSGQVFKWWQGANDGVPTGTTGSGTVTSSTASTLVDSTAAFSNTGGKLIERYVYHIPATGPVQRRRITSNTATALTISPDWSAALVVGDSYIVGGIDWQLDTPWGKSGAAFLKKRFEFMFLEATSDQNSAVAYADVFTKDNLTTAARTIRFDFGTGTAVYGTAHYGTDHYATATLLNSRRKVGLVGKSYRIRIRQLQADKQIIVQKIAMQASVLTTKT